MIQLSLLLPLTSKRSLLLFGALLAIGTTAPAQQQPVWSLDDCMRYAVEHSPKVKKQQHTTDTYRSEHTSAIASLFPSVTVGSQGSFGFGRSINPETNTYNNLSTFNNAYSVSASMPLFDGGQLINQLRAARVKRNQGETGIEKERDDVALLVMQAYIDVVYYVGTVRLATEQLSETNRVFHKTRRQEELGLKGRADVAQIESQVAAGEYNLTHQQNLLNTAVLTLKTHMNLPPDAEVQVDTLFSEQAVVSLTDGADAIFDYAERHNPTARLAALKLRNAEMQHRIYKGQLYPTIAVNAGISTNYFLNLNNNATVTPLPYADQLRNNRGEYVSISFNFPLFQGLRRTTQVRRARNERYIAQEEKSEVLRQLQNAIEQSILDRNGYAKEVEQMKKKVAADELSYQITLRKFEEGLMSPLDLQLSANNLLLAQADLLQRQLSLIIKSRLVAYYGGSPLVGNE